MVTELYSLQAKNNRDGNAIIVDHLLSSSGYRTNGRLPCTNT